MPTSCCVRSIHTSRQSSHSSWSLQHLQKISKKRIVALMTLCPSLFWVFCPQLKLASDLLGKELLGPSNGEKRHQSSASYDEYEYSGNHDQFDSLPFLEKFSHELTDPTVTPSPVAVRPFPPTAKQLSLFNTVWIGALASCSAELSSYPFDFAKTRLQIQSDVIDKLKKGAPCGVPSFSIASRWTGMLDVLVRAPQLSPRGIWVLFDGLRPAILRQATYGTIKIASYEKLKIMLEDKLPPVQCALVAGAAAGALSSAICTPTDLVKVRMAGGDRPDYTSIREGLRLIIKEEGWMALYKGVVPTTQRAMVVTLLNLPTYDIAKLYLMDWHYSDTVTTHFLAGTFAGLFSTIGSNPIDTVKSRIMNQPVDERGRGLLYRNSWHCTVKTVRDEGFAALWKGSVPNCCRNVPWLVIFWCTYEALKKVAEEDKSK